MFSTLAKIQWTLPRLTSVTSDNSLMVRWRSPFSAVLIDAAMDVWMTGSRLRRSSSSIFWRPSLNLWYLLKTMTRLADIFPFLFWSNFSILVVVLPKSAQNLIFALISDSLMQYLKETLFTSKAKVRFMWNFVFVTYAASKNLGKFHDVWFTYELLTVNWTQRFYCYKSDLCIKVNMRIIQKLQNWIGNILFFENMHNSGILPKI